MSDASAPRLADHALDRVRTQLAPPARIAGRYELRGLLGRGGMGEVHRAHDHQLRRDVAIKLLARDASSARFAQRLDRESRVLARLEHPGIVPVHDAGVLEDGRGWYVMRLVEGARWDEYVRAGTSRGELLRTLRRVAEAVGFAHERGVIHRDLKPGNVMIGPFGEVLVLDWGVAKLTGVAEPSEVAAPTAHAETAFGAAEELTAEGTAVGTPGYMAPEQAAGEAVDGRTDVHALGVMLRESLALQGGRVERSLRSIVAKATAPTAADRYSGVLAFAADLRRWLDGEAVMAHREGPLEVAWRFARRHQVAILLLLTYAVVRAVILFWRGI